MGKKYLKTEKKIFTATMAAILAGVFAISTFAVVLFHSFVTGKSDISSGNIENINMTITGMTSGQTASSDITAFTLKKAGDKVTFSVTVSNNTDYNLVHSGTLALKSITQAGNEIGFDDDKYNLIKSCILVYCDGKFVDSLAHITQSGVYEFINDTVLPSNKTDKHEITFELHASATQYADIGFNLYITDYAQNADSNRGKGCAVRTASLQARGKYVVFTDADLAYGTEVIGRIYDIFESNKDCDMVIGSRNMSRDGYEGYTFLRKIASKTYIKVLCMCGGFRLSDSQCGCKAFTGEAAHKIFSRCEVDGFAFDFETILWAQKFGMKIKEMPVKIINHRESKVRLIRDTLKMLSDLRKMKKRIRKQSI